MSDETKVPTRIHGHAISTRAQANFIEVKFTIAQVLDLPVNCAEEFRERTAVRS